jgi:DNA-binding GntR family transcriptional regulator
VADTNLSETIYEQLSERILRWDYMPGHKLTEESLCAEFGVSRSPIREALNSLADSGLIEKKPRTGYSVRTLDFGQIDELYDVRIALEQFVIQKICRQGMDDGKMGELVSYWENLQSRLPETASLVPAADEHFHETLSTFSNNDTLVKTLKDIDKRIHFVRMADITSMARVEATCTEHLALLRALRSRDEALAIEILHRNIEGGRSSVELAIKEALAHAYRNKA